MQDDVPISGYPTTNYMWYTKVVIVILSISDELQASSCRTVTQVWSLPLSFPSTGCGFYAAISSDSCTKHKICIWPNFLMHLDRVCKKLQPWFILSLCLSNLSCLLGSWRHLRPTPPSRCVIFPRQRRGGAMQIVPSFPRSESAISLAKFVRVLALNLNP